MVRVRAEKAEEGDRRPSLVDDAYAAMKEEIRESRFPPGYQASEQEIALRLGMSRTPVHEAAIRLQEDGLVRILSRKGIVICALAPADMREIYDVVIAVEGRAAALIAGLPEAEREAAAARLAAATTAMAEARAAGDHAAWGHADEDFHRTLVERAGNGRMIRINQTINDQSHRARMLTLKLRRELGASVAEHERIVAAIRLGDAAAAQERAQSHRLRARDELLPLLESFGLKHL
ncbi:GntR family transcriptional regulator [Methylobacterium sp. E-041]|jgi:DNA-binding GntR family transcriptional regulator|uniref:GntR family transcriptional regulator n=1 Tax=unclassified Methylobacterium TaxID=2615210 RepID=UPI0011CB1574|nr:MULTISPECIES: GntR family transcriptional regulator [unclassified Methylobacterium]MCJ2075373.1 GntR family transcriptional regulator [Methylobacterium sp. E-016]MCJ2109583.1 GntR family transcriptional regulator [Methylobacterium sp. E-041]TXN49410.1 GntR family transcriptional regulator [Methylobacterium sp. WL119]TXN64310.1 GntR family transcriptional regulator [Methylobacterium sp. WL30]